jgi:hypothetical protein
MIIMIDMVNFVKRFTDSKLVMTLGQGNYGRDSRNRGRLDDAKDAGGQEDDGADQCEHAADGDADQAKWQQEQPYDGVEDQSQKREGPAEDQKNAPKKEFDHGFNVSYARSASFIITQSRVRWFHLD